MLEAEGWQMILRTITVVGCGILLIALCYHQQNRITVLEGQRATMLRELKGKAWELDRVKAIRPELAELRFMAEVFKANDHTIYRVARSAYRWGRHYRISPYLIMSVAHRESNFRPDAVSYVNGQPCAYGIMQINARAWGLDPKKIMGIDENVRIGTEILKHYLDKYKSVGKSLFHFWGGNNDRHGYGYPKRVLESRFYNHVEIGG